MSDAANNIQIGRLFSFRGRASRAEFWTIVGVSTAAMMPAFVSEFRWFYVQTVPFSEHVVRENFTTGERTEFIREGTQTYLTLFSADPTWVTWVPLAAISIPLLAAFARRLHDLGRPTWWLAVALFFVFGLEWVVWLSFLLAAQVSAGFAVLLLFLSWPTVALSSAAILVMTLWTANEGEPEANEYGPVPAGVFQ